jgi:hypothetical protein
VTLSLLTSRFEDDWSALMVICIAKSSATSALMATEKEKGEFGIEIGGKK